MKKFLSVLLVSFVTCCQDLTVNMLFETKWFVCLDNFEMDSKFEDIVVIDID